MHGARLVLFRNEGRTRQHHRGLLVVDDVAARTGESGAHLLQSLDANANARAQRTQYGLPRSARVRKRGAFVEIQRDGRKTGGTDLVMLVLAQRKPGPSRVGVTASRRVGGAVVRNRLKRYVREVFRQHRAWFPDGSDVVFVARPSAAALGYAEVHAQIEALCARHAGRAATRRAR